MVHFLQLPPEVLGSVTDRLSKLDLKSLTLVSRHFRKLALPNLFNKLTTKFGRHVLDYSPETISPEALGCVQEAHFSFFVVSGSSPYRLLESRVLYSRQAIIMHHLKSLRVAELSFTVIGQCQPDHLDLPLDTLQTTLRGLVALQGQPRIRLAWNPGCINKNADALPVLNAILDSLPPNRIDHLELRYTQLEDQALPEGHQHLFVEKVQAITSLGCCEFQYIEPTLLSSAGAILLLERVKVLHVKYEISSDGDEATRQMQNLAGMLKASQSSLQRLSISISYSFEVFDDAAADSSILPSLSLEEIVMEEHALQWLGPWLRRSNSKKVVLHVSGEDADECFGEMIDALRDPTILDRLEHLVTYFDNTAVDENYAQVKEICEARRIRLRLYVDDMDGWLHGPADLANWLEEAGSSLVSWKSWAFQVPVDIFEDTYQDDIDLPHLQTLKLRGCDRLGPEAHGAVVPASNVIAKVLETADAPHLRDLEITLISPRIGWLDTLIHLLYIGKFPSLETISGEFATPNISRVGKAFYPVR